MNTGHTKLKRTAHLLLYTFIICSCAISKYAANSEYPQIDSRYTGNGILEECFHPCSVPGPKERRMYVYLPADYYETDRRYPVLYLLHGARGNEMSWIVKGDILHSIDSLTGCGKMQPCIVVMPNTNQHNDDADYGKSRRKNAVASYFEVNGTVESAFVRDVVGTTDSLYRTLPQKEFRAIAGLSIGGLQTIYITASNPDTFDYIGIFSPLVHPFLRSANKASIYHGLKTKHMAQFADPPKVYLLMAGKRDLLHHRTETFSRYMLREGYPHELHITSGGHEWSNWKKYCNKLMQVIFDNNPYL
ncbi:MAG: hypothetical protein IJ005_01545 [Bacteroidales bacterium]|nr:hypothetical protein [Bacteroidales bacterium]